MKRAGADLVRRALLDDSPEVENGDPVGDAGHDREVMRNEEVGQPGTLTQVEQEVHDLRRDGHVERGTGSSQTTSRGPVASARAIATRCLCPPERSAAGAPRPREGGRRLSRAPERAPGAVGPARGPGRAAAPRSDRRHASAGFKRRLRILEHDLEIPASPAQFAAVKGQPVFSLETGCSPRPDPSGAPRCGRRSSCRFRTRRRGRGSPRGDSKSTPRRAGSEAVRDPNRPRRTAYLFSRPAAARSGSGAGVPDRPDAHGGLRRSVLVQKAARPSGGRRKRLGLAQVAGVETLRATGRERACAPAGGPARSARTPGIAAYRWPLRGGRSIEGAERRPAARACRDGTGRGTDRGSRLLRRCGRRRGPAHGPSAVRRSRGRA